MIQYGIIWDVQEENFSIIRWDDEAAYYRPWVRHDGDVVQTGIRTRAKAMAARLVWQQREADKHVPQH